MSFSLHDFVLKEIQEMSHASLGGKLRLMVAGLAIVVVYVGMILFVASVTRLAYEREASIQAQEKVAGAKTFHSRSYIIQTSQ